MQGLSAAHQSIYDEILQGVQQLPCEDLQLRDREETFDRKTWEACAGLGLCGLTVPVELGGSGFDPLSAVVAMEAFGRGCPDNGLGLAIGAHLWGCLTIMLAGDQARNAALIRELADGRKIGALAISEPGAGSDLGGIETTATAATDGYRLNGHKIYVTNAPVADVIVVLAATPSNNAAFAHSAFFIERGTPGLTVSAPVSKMGMRTAAMGEVTLKDCIIPQAQRIGAEGAGLPLFLKAMEAERAFILAPAVGAMERLYACTAAYAQNRRQFGQPIAEFESVFSKLAEIHRRTSIARSALQQAAAKKSAGKSIALEAAMAKLTISESWVASCRDALAIYAGKGYLSETGIERQLRDAEGSQLYSGTPEVLRRTIARLLRVIP